MKNKMRVLLLAAATLGILAPTLPVWSQGAGPARAQAADTRSRLNSIQSLDVADNGGTVFVRLTTQTPLAAVPASFTVANPPRVAFDFPGMGNGLGRGVQSIERGDVRSANVVQVGDRTRLVLNLARLLPYETRINGKTLTIAFTAAGSGTSAAPLASTPGIGFATPAAKGSANAAATTAANANTSTNANAASGVGQSISDINFRRGSAGEGRVVVQLSSADVGVDVRQLGGKLIVSFLKAALPDNLRRRSDVTDFGTPVTQLLAEQQGENVRLTVTPSGLWEHNAYQSDNQFVLEVKRIVEDPNRLVQRGGHNKYRGEKLSLNFQNVDVRSVLQVIADFTDFNIVTSDSVQGNLTLRLKDVPWDQALDIILQAKGLDMRKSGNVIWIAPGEELAVREKLINEAKAQLEELEPLQTESFQINYHKATDITKFLQSKEQTVLSKRGSAVFDDRSNKIFITDVGTRLTDVRRIITEIDVAPRQVLIEARIVEAEKNFARDLGVKLGYGDTTLRQVGNGAQLGFGQSQFGTSKLDTTKNPPFSFEALDPVKGGSWNSWTVLDATPGGARGENNYGAAPIQSGRDVANPFGVLNMTILNHSWTRFLNIELQANETDGKVRTVSSPRVLTANNVEALIEDGTEVPYQEASSSGATSVSFKKAVLSLKVKPQITPDGRLQLTVQVNKDNVLLEQAVSGVPPIATKSVKSDVLIENGGTVVIGGIYVEDERNSVSKVPLLGDIPFLGYLFRTTNKNTAQKELLVFVTPRIVDEELTLR
jgi:type IV pilus assembly protein PilQ